MTTNPSGAVTLLVRQAAAGDAHATDELLPLVYEELRRMARAHLADEAKGITLQPTALVHEAYLRLVGGTDVEWNSRGHFFGAAALAMRRILVERARHHSRLKRGGDRSRTPLTDLDMQETLGSEPGAETMLAVDELLDKLENYDSLKARIVMLRYFAGLTLEQIGAALELPHSKIKSEWTYARAWMHRELGHAPDARS